MPEEWERIESATVIVTPRQAGAEQHGIPAASVPGWLFERDDNGRVTVTLYTDVGTATTPDGFVVTRLINA